MGEITPPCFDLNDTTPTESKHPPPYLLQLPVQAVEEAKQVLPSLPPEMAEAAKPSDSPAPTAEGGCPVFLRPEDQGHPDEAVSSPAAKDLPGYDPAHHKPDNHKQTRRPNAMHWASRASGYSPSKMRGGEDGDELGLPRNCLRRPLHASCRLHLCMCHGTRDGGDCANPASRLFYNLLAHAFPKRCSDVWMHG